MIPANALVAQLQAYVRGGNEAPLIQIVDALQDIRQLFTVGEQVRAQVTSQLPGGRYAVMVKDQLLDLNLPRNTQPGEEFDMQVVANSPRLAFLLQRQPAAGPQQQPAPTGGGASTEVELSDTARFIGSVLTGAGEADGDPAAAQSGPLVRAQPLFGAALPEPARMADTLRQALSESGTFYESHLAEWAGGERPLEQLLREPPARWSNPAAADARPDARQTEQRPGEARTSDARGADAARQAQQPWPAREAERAAASDQLSFTGATRGSEVDALPPGARQLVQQQLQALDQRQVVWLGQAWPGQPMRWEVEEDRSGQSGELEAAPTVWRTRLTMDLPKLGHVEAVIGLFERTRIEMGFRVADPAVAERIRAEQGRLQSSLDAAGLELVANQVTLAGDER
ncbi:flagellar hook-length control protein FliK [Chitinimonas koreensis]|uniref:flagellar hook-length control protein FliK n=1 Tax=Chitinimonas koreensis TaxID=356302 RepID=UPI00041A6820|nr:flagellar hook-length control protein FliK [Chitinimonas koreensis]QNM98509.1 flagellar hook-length control protein FliK [Chitinimonas koreensis]